MSITVQDSQTQRIDDSEHDYLNSTFWDVYPLFLLVQEGDEEGFRHAFDTSINAFPTRVGAFLTTGRIGSSERKQLEYLTVSLVNTFMIAAILGGVYPPEANWVADRALKRLSTFEDTDELPSLVYDEAIELCHLVREARRSDTGNFYVEQAKQYLSTHLTQEIRGKDVASAVGLSPAYLSRLFKRCCGQTMRGYLVAERIKAAQHLLVTDDRSIAQIASLLRFCDQSYFTQAFRRHTGLTPGQYRNANRR